MGMTGRTIVVVGEVRSEGDLTLDGRVEGPVWCEGALTIAPSGAVTGKIVARDITVFGRAEGQLAATEVVDVRLGANVRGDVVSPHFILHEGAQFNGRVDPAQLNAAVSVARFQQRQRDNEQLTTNNEQRTTDT
jgi:cytoskeletal protein CcmA (bactofilin family)